jgi:hypothetical protein
MRRRLAGLAGTAVLLGSLGVGVLPGLGAAARGDDLPAGLIGTASAEGFRMTYGVPHFVIVEEFIDGGGPVAQSLVDSSGRSVAFASLPYPGANGIAFPGLASLVTGQSVPVSYPFYAASDYPSNPSSEVKDPSGSYELKANSDAGKAAGAAEMSFGPGDQPASRSVAHTSIVTDADGKMTVTAESVSNGISVGGGTLRIATVESRSVSTYVPGQDKPTTTKQLHVEGAKIGDTPVTIGPDGVHAGGSGIPVPFGQGNEQLNQALAQSGISVRTASSTGKSGGVDDILEIRSKHPVPNPGGGTLEGTFVVRYGGTTTGIVVGGDAPPAAPAADAGGAAPSDTGVAAPSDAGAPAWPPPPTSAESAAGGPAALPPVGGWQRAGGSSMGAFDGAVPPAAPDEAVAAAAPMAQTAAAMPETAPTPESAVGEARMARSPRTLLADPAAVTTPEQRHSLRVLFSVIGLGAVVFLVAAALWWKKGVRIVWTP